MPIPTEALQGWWWYSSLSPICDNNNLTRFSEFWWHSTLYCEWVARVPDNDGSNGMPSIVHMLCCWLHNRIHFLRIGDCDDVYSLWKLKSNTSSTLLAGSCSLADSVLCMHAGDQKSIKATAAETLCSWRERTNERQPTDSGWQQRIKNIIKGNCEGQGR